FGERGARVGDIVMAWDRFVFHDRRIPLGPFEAYGVGDLPAADLRRLARRRGWRLGPVTTGDSLDATDTDRAAMAASGAEAKEMEAAAVARVAGWHRIPVTALKAVTDLVDHPVDTAHQFAENLHRAVEALTEACVALVDAVATEGLDAWSEGSA
ncbi:MAG: 5'-methylthioadenosine nucleosidase, partial [Actinomyces sp.]